MGNANRNIRIPASGNKIQDAAARDLSKALNQLSKGVNAAPKSNGNGTEGNPGDIRIVKDYFDDYYLEAKSDEGWLSSLAGVFHLKGKKRANPYKPYFASMYENGTTTAHYPNNTTVQWTGATEAHLEGFSFASDQLTPLQGGEGWYDISARVSFKCNNAGKDVYWLIAQNGTEITGSKALVNATSANTYYEATPQCQVFLTPTDTIDLRVFTADSNTITTIFVNFKVFRLKTP